MSPSHESQRPKACSQKGQEECARAAEGEELPRGGALIEGTPQGAWQGALLPLQPPLSESILSQGRRAWSQEEERMRAEPSTPEGRHTYKHHEQ